MRHINVKNSYVKTGWREESEILKIGDQMAYEWQQDFIIMKWALIRISEFLEVAQEKGSFTGTLHIAKSELLNRISQFSCPSNLKKHLRKKENCLLKEKCKCVE